MKNIDTNNTAFYYSVNLLKMLLSMGLLTQEEFEKTVTISATHYGTEKIYV